MQSSQFSSIDSLPNLLQTERKLDEMNALTLISFSDGFRNSIYPQNRPHLEMKNYNLKGKQHQVYEGWLIVGRLAMCGL